MIKRAVSFYVHKVPYIKRLREDSNELKARKIELKTLKSELRFVQNWITSNETLNYPWFVTPGHYYSPLVANDAKLTFAAEGAMKEVPLPGIALNKDVQLRTLKKLQPFFKDFPYTAKINKKYRYQTKNDQFAATDAASLYGMVKLLQPKNIVEVGSGWSSALMLDINDTLKSKINLTFIEPHPDRLYSTFREGDKERCKVVETSVQDVDLTLFSQLKENDIVFIDNSHISKSGSDVNFLMFEVLPQLKPGVVVHIHDIFYPFEYPKGWIEQKRNWNETFVVRAFLAHNSAFEILFWENYLDATQNKVVLKSMKNSDGFGGSLWLRKSK